MNGESGRAREVIGDMHLVWWWLEQLVNDIPNYRILHLVHTRVRVWEILCIRFSVDLFLERRESVNSKNHQLLESRRGERRASRPLSCT